MGPCEGRPIRGACRVTPWDASSGRNNVGPKRVGRDAPRRQPAGFPIPDPGPVVVAAVLGGGLGYAIIAIGVGFIPAFVRITRAKVLTIRSLDYVEAARATGSGNTMILLRHVLPNSLPPLLVQTTLAIGYAIIAEATLSFLGLGAERGPELGVHALPGPVLPTDGVVDGVLPRYGHLLRRARFQPAR